MDRDGDEWGSSAEFARLLAQFESGRAADTPSVGSQVRGKVVQIGEETLFVDFGGRSEGAVEAKHFRDAEGKLTVSVGSEVELFVIENEDQVILAPSVRAEPEVALGQILEAHRTGMPISGRVIGQNSGGLEIDIAGLRGFCPVSQIEAGFCPDPSVHLGHTLEFLVTECAEGGKRMVVSRKALLRRQEEEQARRVIESLREGSEMDGTVARLERFGAFVDLGGVDGLVHVSEIRHERTENPADILTVGQRVRVRVLGVKEQAGQRPRIALSIKAAAPDPWDDADERFWAGRRLSGTVARLTDFGAFVTLAPGIDGLVHVSEVDLKPVGHVRDVLKVGQTVDVVVLSVERDKKRISLSIKDALAADQATPEGAGGEAGGPGAGAAPRNPAVGDLAEGWVAGIKPYGLFVDLPAYGHRVRGLVPHEETGEKRGTDLSRRFRVGDALRVEIIDIDHEGKIRLSLTRAQEKAEQAGFAAFQAQQKPDQGRGPSTAMAEALRRAMEKRKGEESNENI